MHFFCTYCAYGDKITTHSHSGVRCVIQPKAVFYASSSTAACAAARRAIGTRNGEQEA